MGLVGQTIELLAVTFMSSLLLIIMGLVYFMITLWTVKTGANLLGLSPDHSWTVFSASLIAGASMIGSSIHKN